MVYCGRPSTGCATCRKRRIKCDEARPVCGQCIKSKRHCLGYREETDILFRNENAVTARRVRREPVRIRNTSSTSKTIVATSPKKPDSSSSTVSVLEGGSSQLPASFFSHVVGRSLSSTNEEIAVKFLFDNFDRVPRHSERSHAYIEYLPGLFAKAPSNSALSAVTAAISLGTWGGYTSRPECLVEARKRYGQAIVRANAAIQDPVAAKKNETLMAILLFALFEALNAKNAETLPQWNLHTKGALALVKHRGDEMFENEISRKLFQAVQQQTMISQLNRPDSRREEHASSQFWPSGIQTTPADTLTYLIFKVPALRNSSINMMSRPRSTENDSAVWALLGACKAVDSALAAWPKSLDENWRPVKILRVPNVVNPSSIDWENAEAYPGDVVAYNDIWVTSIWNTYRNARMFINAIVLQCLAWLMPDTGDLPEDMLRSSMHTDCIAARAVLQEMANGTCAAVPFQLSMIEESRLDTASPKSSTGSSIPSEQELRHQFERASFTSTSHKCTHYPNGDFHGEFADTTENLGHTSDGLARSLGAYYLIWPLFVAQAAITISPYQRRWIRGRLTYISRNFGLQQAKLLATSNECQAQSGRPLFTRPVAETRQLLEDPEDKKDWIEDQQRHLLS